MEITIKRLTTGDVGDARATFALMANVFEEECEVLSAQYLNSLLCERASGQWQRWPAPRWSAV